MNNKDDKTTNGFGLLAAGVSNPWSIDIDESLDCDEWSLTIEGPQVYLVFQLDDLAILRKTLHFLQSNSQFQPSREDRECDGQEDTLILGRFGSASVCLRKDNEDFIRYFLVVGSQANSTFHISLFADDIQKIIEALAQVVDDIPVGGAEK